ncbi:MAG: BON domain-containing protein [Humidesulfovibrio sp.]|uniref:BON domain-containing protein n=1 Tax=Humidesulfovibrio sp. TaxID=2910988 RepID=UPI002733BF55|nr:BON domain-containing protein [Humidesulfovibrio sp.]MDP2846743.1 BON domain-containing protein [Humidesulfovibrio sp.]
MSAQTALLLFIAVIVVAFALTRLRPSQQSGDAAISALVVQALAKEFPFSNVHVDVKTFDGIVILGGFVREHEQMTKAIETARAIEGVKSVDNRISVRSGG